MGETETLLRSAPGPSLTALIALVQGIADPVRLGLVRYLAEKGETTAAELGEHCQASGATIRRHLEALVSSGIVAEAPGASDGATPGRPAARFSLRPEARESLAHFLVLYRCD
jgi:predicted ArsR family transcriptional regulator